MIFGAAEKETVQLNEDSLWEGDEKDSGMYQNLGEFEVDIAWKDGKVTSYRIAANDKRKATARVNGEKKVITCERN